MRNNIIKNESIIKAFEDCFLNEKDGLEIFKQDLTELYFNHAELITEADRDELPPQKELNNGLCALRRVIKLISCIEIAEIETAKK